MKNYKYKTSFESKVVASTDITGMNISAASLDHLSGLIPENIDFDKNIDLVGVAFNAAVANRFNRNGDGISGESAVAIKKYFIHKPCNIEHQKENIVGHIVSAGLSQYNSENKAFNYSEGSEEPFNIALGAVVYRSVSPEFADIIVESSDESSDYYNSVSASWEIGFNDFVISVGDTSSNLSEHEIISDPAGVEELSSYLKSFGGKGELEDGRQVSRLIIGEIFPLGIGFTNNPAADVKGVFVPQKNASNADATTNEELAQEDVAQEKSSHLNNDTVIQEEQTFFQNIMEKQELLKDIEQLLSEKAAAKDFSDEAIASITKVFHEAIREKSEDYVKQVKQVEAEKAEAQTQKEELAGELSALKEQLESTEKKLNGLEEEKVERESQARFNSRMSAIEEVYDLDEEDLKVVASEVVTLDETEESFSQYQEKLAVVFKSKSKEYLQQLADEMEAKITAEVEKRLSQKSEASTETSVEQASDVAEQSLENAEAEEAVLPNNNGESIETEETLRDRFAKAFRDNVKVTY